MKTQMHTWHVIREKKEKEKYSWNYKPVDTQLAITKT